MTHFTQKWWDTTNGKKTGLTLPVQRSIIMYLLKAEVILWWRPTEDVIKNPRLMFLPIPAMVILMMVILMMEIPMMVIPTTVIPMTGILMTGILTMAILLPE